MDNSTINKQMTLAFLLPNLYGGGTERVVTTISEELSKRKLKIFIFTLEKGKQYDLASNVKHIVLSNLDIKKHGIFKRILYFPIQLFNFIKLLKSNKITIVISFLERANFINCISKIFIKHKVICNTRMNLTEGYLKGANPIAKLIILNGIKLLKKYYDILICNSQGVKEDLVSNFKLSPKIIKVIHNPCDIKKIRELSKKNLEAKYENLFLNPVIINVASLIKPKGQWHLIRAFKLVKEKIEDSKLILIGDGENKNLLNNLINDYKLNNDVFLLGFKENPFAFMSRSKIFVLSSLWEGFPNALLEAMACGLPVISFDCKSGPREILSQNPDINKEINDIEYAEYGVLVPVPDGKFYGFDTSLLYQEKLLATSIIKLLENKELYKKYAALSSERIKDFELNKIANKYFEMIRTISNK